MILIDTSVLEVPSGGFSWVVEQGTRLLQPSCLRLLCQYIMGTFGQSRLLLRRLIRRRSHLPSAAKASEQPAAAFVVADAGQSIR